MPKLPIDYSKALVYKIVCNDLSITDCYIGSTTDFIRRKSEHKRKYKFGTKTKLYDTIRENGGFENWDFIEIEKHPCNDKNECHKRERYYIELYKSSLNMAIPARTQAEYKEENIEKINAYKKQWNIDNKEKMKEYMKKYYNEHKA